jgi:hypothetical protein
MAVGLLESFELIECFGSEVVRDGIITIEDIMFAVAAKKKKGCRSIASRLTAEDNQRVIELGRIIKKWKDER